MKCEANKDVRLMEGDGQGCPSPVFHEKFWCSLQPPVIELAELSLLSLNDNHDKVTSRLSLLPPVPQNLSPSLAVFGISPVAQKNPSPTNPASLQKPGFPF